MSNEQIIDHNTCWHSAEVVESINRFYDQYVKNPEINQHLQVVRMLLEITGEQGMPVLDLGCGSGFLSDYCTDYQYCGADLPHILGGSSMRNNPQHWYRVCDIEKDDIRWVGKFPIVIVNGVLDIFQYPVEMLNKLLSSVSKYLIIHRQEITTGGETRSIQKPSYNSYTYHSIINRGEFEHEIDMMGFDIVKEIRLTFGDWEAGGSSFLLRKRNTWALNGIDLELNRLFNGKENGYYLEAGCNDGIRQSNTLHLERYKNWRGILIEPIESLYNQCKENRSAKNSYFNCALIPTDGDVHINYAPDTDGLTSSISNPAYNTMQIIVPGRSLNSILSSLDNVPQVIDLLSLDVEGYEAIALQGLDLSRYNIAYMLIEELVDNNDVPNVIGSHYERVEKLSNKDWLYKRKI